MATKAELTVKIKRAARLVDRAVEILDGAAKRLDGEDAQWFQRQADALQHDIDEQWKGARDE